MCGPVRENEGVSSAENTPVRPPQATLAAWMVIICSVYVVLTSIETLGTLTSLAAREAATELIDQTPQFKSLSVDTLLDVRRWAGVGAAVLGGVAAVLGFFAWRRDRAARTGLAVVAVPLFLVGMVTSSLMTILAAASVIMLFREPVASWFAGRPLPAPPERGSFGGPRSTVAPSGQLGPDAGGAADWTPQEPGNGSMPRPRQVLAAVAVTWIFATVSVLIAVATAAVVATERDLLWEQMLKQSPDIADQGITPGLVQAMGIIMSLVLVALAVAAIVCAMALLQRKKWGALGLIALCLMFAMFCLMSVLVNPVMLLPGAAAVYVIAMVRSRDSRVWVLTAPRADGSGPGQFGDQHPDQFRQGRNDQNQASQGQPPVDPAGPLGQTHPHGGTNPYGVPGQVAPPGRRRAQRPLDAESQVDPSIERTGHHAAVLDDGSRTEGPSLEGPAVEGSSAEGSDAGRTGSQDRGPQGARVDPSLVPDPEDAQSRTGEDTDPRA